MGEIRVNSEVYSAIAKFSKDKTISYPEQQALGMIMMQDGIDAQDQQVLDALANKVAFSITDGTRTTTLDPKVIEFADKPPPTQAERDLQNPVRQEIYTTLTQAGLPQKEIADTFSYLDRVGVSDADTREIFKQQQARRHGPEDTLAAMQAFGVIQESVRIPDLNDSNKHFLQKVAAELKTGNYRIDADTKEKMRPTTLAMANSLEDSIYYRQFDINNPEQRAVILHELVHASHDVDFQDKQHLEISAGFSEMDAHLAEGLYLLEAERQGEYTRGPTSDNEILDFASSYREHLRAEQVADLSPDDPQLAQREREAYQKFSATEDNFRANLIVHRGYARAFMSLMHADGISQK